jgi:sugar phosphate isomerase/epimerase
MIQSRSFRDRLVSSPVYFPHLPLEPALRACSKLGFAKFEGFTEWAASKMDWRDDPAKPRRLAESMGLRFSSFHLPTVKSGADSELSDLMVAARFGAGLGARVVLFKAASREIFASLGPRFLDALSATDLGLTPVLQNHRGGPIQSLDDFRAVLHSLNNDPRMKTLLEVGQFHRVGVEWKTGWEWMGERIALIHVNDIRDGQSVLYGTGEVDLRGLMRRVKTSGYDGDIVVELELPSREVDSNETLEGVRLAVEHLEAIHRDA